MKKTIALLLSVLLLLSLTACGASASADYQSAEELEAALNNGVDCTGKTVSFTVEEYVPDSLFGCNMQAGEHLNFIPESDPKVSDGDTVTVEITEVNDLLGSYIISCKMQ